MSALSTACGRRMALLLSLFLCLASGAGATTEENEASQRLTAEATQFLDQLVGPGRSKVLVTVQGEASETMTQTDQVTPIKKPGSLSAQAGAAQNPSAPMGTFLPGYLQDSQPPSTSPDSYYKDNKGKSAPAQPQDFWSNFDLVQKDQEQTRRRSGLTIRSIHATVILDPSVGSQADLIRRVLTDLLGVSPSRGDVLAVHQAPLLPPWKRLLLGNEVLRPILRDATRIILWFLAALGLLAFLGAIGYFISMKLVRTFVSEMAEARRLANEPRPALAGEGRVEELPEIMPDGVPALSDDETMDAESAEPAGALGRRFDFLAEVALEDMTEYLSREKPEELALLFGYLAKTDDSLAGKLFSALPAQLQASVSANLSHLSSVEPEKISALEERLHKAVETGIRGADRLGRILSRIPAPQREGILGDMMSRDPVAAEKVESSLLPFESLGNLADPQMRRLLTAVPYQEWGVALRGAPEEMVNRILLLLPAQAQAALRDYLESPQPVEKVMEARSKILSSALNMSAQGLLQLKPADTSKLV